ERVVVVKEGGYAFPAAHHVVLGLHDRLEAAGADREEREDDHMEGLLAITQPRLLERGWVRDTFLTETPQVALEQFAFPCAAVLDTEVDGHRVGEVERPFAFGDALPVVEAHAAVRVA